MDYLVAAGVLIYSAVLFVLFGWSESLYWHYLFRAIKFRKYRPVKYEHELWRTMSTFFHLPVGVLLIMYWGWFSIMGVVGLVAMSFFWHDGMYYLMRNKWDNNYPKKWKSYSLTSTAKNTYDWYTRRNLFIWGFLLYCMMFLSKI